MKLWCLFFFFFLGGGWGSNRKWPSFKACTSFTKMVSDPGKHKGKHCDSEKIQQLGNGCSKSVPFTDFNQSLVVQYLPFTDFNQSLVVQYLEKILTHLFSPANSWSHFCVSWCTLLLWRPCISVWWQNCNIMTFWSIHSFSLTYNGNRITKVK